MIMIRIQNDDNDHSIDRDHHLYFHCSREQSIFVNLTVINDLNLHTM